MKKVFSLVLALVLTLSMIPAAYAAGRFSDVTSTHWAYSDIQALADGGLVNGVGDNKFDPDAVFTIAAMSQIICNAQGFDTKVASGELWYKNAVQHCIDIGCLPSRGAITNANYNVECPRELAVYMLVTGLGIPGGKTAKAIEADYIPDYGQVTMMYRDAVLKAYQYQLLTGIDDNHTFNPKGGLKRSEACALLNRAGYTTAADKATTGEGAANAEVISKLRATGLFTEATTDTGITVFTATERKYAGLEVSVSKDKGISIKADEVVPSLTYVESSVDVPNIVDEDGNVYCDRATSMEPYYYNAAGKYMPPSGLSYNSRQLLKQVLNIVFPTQGEEAYSTFMGVLTPPHTYANGYKTPSAIKWLDSRVFNMQAVGGYVIYISALNDLESYDYLMAQPAQAKHNAYSFARMGEDVAGHKFISGIAAYELDKW